MKNPKKQSFYYTVFYEINGELASTNRLIGINKIDIRKKFKKIYGGFKIVTIQKNEKI